MLINEEIISIPPFISTSWENVCSLQIKDSEDMEPGTPKDVVIYLKEGNQVTLPQVPPSLLEHIFTTHAQFLQGQEQKLEEEEIEAEKLPDNLASFFQHLIQALQSGKPSKIPIYFSFSGSEHPEDIAEMMRHDASQAESPPLPKELLIKVAQMAKNLNLEGSIELPHARPACHCPHCQVARVIHFGLGTAADENSDPDVCEQDLNFRGWDIQTQGTDHYLAVNPLNADERYRVFLGNPVGCTCGKKNCEHIKAVLRS